MIKTNNMDYTKFNTGFNKPAIFTAQTYGTKTSVELDHSDLDLDEVMDVFRTLIVGMGYSPDMWKQWILERADEYREEDEERFYQPNQALKDAAEKYDNLRHSTDNFEDYQNKND